MRGCGGVHLHIWHPLGTPRSRRGCIFNFILIPVLKSWERPCVRGRSPLPPSPWSHSFRKHPTAVSLRHTSLTTYRVKRKEILISLLGCDRFVWIRLKNVTYIIALVFFFVIASNCIEVGMLSTVHNLFHVFFLSFLNSKVRFEEVKIFVNLYFTL